MYDPVVHELARTHGEGRLRTPRVTGIRRSARLISMEVRRSRRVGHPK
jgi:hypothetical protein